MVEAFKKIQSDDRVQNTLQDHVASVFDDLTSIPLLQGHLLSNVSLTTGSNAINHKLQGKLTGWFLTDIVSPAQIYKASSTVTTLTLVTDADTIISLWVF